MSPVWIHHWGYSIGYLPWPLSSRWPSLYLEGDRCGSCYGHWRDRISGRCARCSSKAGH